jgi:hypothetical protein
MKLEGIKAMTAHVQELLHTFDLLPDRDKEELAAEILRRSMTLEMPPLSDEQLVGAAEELFLQLDRNEAADAAH